MVTYETNDGLKREWAVLLHLLTVWYPAGHKNVLGTTPTPSRDVVGGTCKKVVGVRSWYELTGALASSLSAVFETFMPDVYKEFKAAFEAGRCCICILTHQKPGLQSPSLMATSPEGACCFLLCLLNFFKYERGHMILSYSGHLAHTVKTWESTHLNEVPEDLQAQGITPGRVGQVFMCPEATFKVCKDKPADWGKKSGYGRTLPVATGQQQHESQQLRRQGMVQDNATVDTISPDQDTDMIIVIEDVEEDGTEEEDEE
ncbi:hypothetical protein EUX98_g9116 [Antrodiella citrinella]|uniref:Uncharacterized protein n=1 Tax=Antrodiella citrinella TaxID=2447956 RepID=A0A4V3XFG9_9APHY|nr:hypothetical protein EUX98_g9116 [Antrodiella citrinella]